jgi:hypothetical protein
LFGKDLFADENLTSIALELAGAHKHKPFECVGTHEETSIALYLAIQQYNARNQPLPPVLAAVQTQVIAPGSNWDGRAHALQQAWSDQHSLPPEWEVSLRRQLNQTMAQSNI